MRTGASPRGFALLSAIAMLVLVSIVALDLATATRARRRSVANSSEHTAAAAVAQAGIERAVADLTTRLFSVANAGARQTSTIDPWQSLEALAVTDAPLGAFRYSTTLRDAGTSLHLGRASEDQLRGLFSALRIDAARSDRLAQAIMDWRDPDDLRRARGAERADYLRLHRVLLPGDAALTSVASLRHVVGMTEPLYELIAPHLTVVGSGRINVGAADRPVLLTLPGMTEETVALIVRRRRERGSAGELALLASELSPGARQRLLEHVAELTRLTVPDTREVLVTSTARDATGTVRARIEAIVVREGGVRTVWRRVAP